MYNSVINSMFGRYQNCRVLKEFVGDDNLRNKMLNEVHFSSNLCLCFFIWFSKFITNDQSCLGSYFFYEETYHCEIFVIIY